MKKIILFAVISILLVPLSVNAELSMKLTMKDSFSPEETISFNYTISSDFGELISYAPYIICPRTASAIPGKKNISILKDAPFEGQYTSSVVNAVTEPQTCTAYVEITSPVYLREEKTFRIETNPKIELEVNSCKDSGCLEKAKLFNQNQTIYLEFTATEGADLQAEIKLPDNTTQEINLPHSFTAEQLGTYKLTVTAQKEGYRETEQKIQFGAIEKEPEIKNAIFPKNTPNPNQTAEQTPTSTPTDTSTEETDNTLLILGAIIAIIAIILIVGFFKLKK